MKTPRIVLKVWEVDGDLGDLICNNSHYHGGIDMRQEYLFHHLVPKGVVPFHLKDLFFDLAYAHGWEVEITEYPEKKKNES